MRELFPAGVPRVGAILSGHSHYDHLLDVAPVAERWFPEARIIGNATARYILQRRAGMAERFLAVDSLAVAGDGTNVPGDKWFYPIAGDSSVRVLAIISGHAPQYPLFGGVTFFRDHWDREIPIMDIGRGSRLPFWAYDWARGTPLAYVIEFLDSRDAVAFRVHVQDAASTKPLGWIPEPIRGTPLDVAIVCVGNFDLAEGYPAEFLAATQPRFALLGHWEEFVTKQPDRLLLNHLVIPERLVARLKVAGYDPSRFGLPYPGVPIRVCRCNGGAGQYSVTQ
jgi:hypothetical protein